LCIRIDFVRVSLRGGVVQACAYTPPPPQDVLTICAGLRLARDRFVNANATATFANLPIDVDPFSLDGKKWLNKARGVFKQLAPKYWMLKVTLTGGSSEELDAVQAAFDYFPRMVGATLAFILGLVAMYVPSSPALALFSLCFSLTLTPWSRCPSLSPPLHRLSDVERTVALWR
jgi:hypothetical protein